MRPLNLIGINQKDSRVLSSENINITASQITGGFFANGVTSLTTLNMATYVDLIFPATRTAFSYNERIVYAGHVNGETEYTGEEAEISLSIPDSLTLAPSAGADSSIMVKMQIDDGGGYVDLPDNVETEIFFKGTPVTVPITRKVTVKKGDKLKLQAIAVTSTNITVTSGDVMI